MDRRFDGYFGIWSSLFEFKSVALIVQTNVSLSGRNLMAQNKWWRSLAKFVPSILVVTAAIVDDAINLAIKENAI